MSNSTTGPGTIPPPLPAFDNTLGAVVLGGLFTMALWGITCLQTYDFYMEKSRDKKPFKLLIFALWIMDTIDAAMICHTVYFYGVSNYVNPRVIAGPTWSFWVHAGVTILANSIIRGLFTVRIYRMSQFNMAATLWIMATSLACLIAGYIAISKGSHLSTFAELDEILAAIYVTFISGAVSDISVAIILCILLHKSKTQFSKTNSLIKVLMLYTINTSFIVAIDDLVILITKCVMPNNLVFMAFYFCLGKCTSAKVFCSF
ncbi:hypothetical protein VKT23_009211 [Stygiomarasmius scandens]|uniref:DUF6534 domain-containing protein n=1 Tax=Marasmiellus scandens TaxID=2682957 RepID=A0ABR1JHH3_9AGAR